MFDIARISRRVETEPFPAPAHSQVERRLESQEGLKRRRKCLLLVYRNNKWRVESQEGLKRRAETRLALRSAPLLHVESQEGLKHALRR